MPDVIHLWPDGAPGSEGWSQQEADYVFHDHQPHRVTRNVTDPTLTVYLPEAGAATGTGVIVCPGGAHHFLAVDHEGDAVARWLSGRGIAAFVLKYRVIETPADDAAFLESRAQSVGRYRAGERSPFQEKMRAHWPLELADGQQALRLVRERVQEWGLRADRIGMLGFSAGGHLSAGVALANESDCRPDFIAPIYGVLRQDVVDIVVSEDAPPLFTALASNDPIAVKPCLALYTAWHAAGRPAEMHIYAQGGHGFGMFKQGLPSDAWIERFGEWLAAQGLLQAPA